MKKRAKSSAGHPAFKLRQTLRGHEDQINFIAWSPDGRYLASASVDRTIQIWDGQTGEPIKTLEGHTDLIFSVAWSFDGQRIASGSWDETIRIWDGQTGEPIKTLEEHESPILDVAWSPDGRLASGSLDGMIRIWDGQTGKPIKTLEGHQADVCSVAWSPDGQWLASGSGDKTIILWDGKTGRRGHILEGHTETVCGVSFSPDGRLLASRSADDTVRLWRVGDWRELASISELSSNVLPTPVFHPQFPNPPLLATFGEEEGEAERTILIWELDLTQLLGEAPPAESRFYRNAKIALVGDTGVGKTGLALVMSGQEWQPTESSHGRHVWTIDKGETKIEGKDVGAWALSIIEEREVLLWDLAGQPGYRLVHRLHLHDVAVAAVVFDARSETEPFAGVDYWARAVDQATYQNGFKAVKILVVARSDRGGLSVSQERLDEVKERLGFATVYETSAKAGQNVDALKKALLQAIPWDELPFITTPDVFARIKKFLKAEKEKGRILAAHEDLFDDYAVAHPKYKDEDEAFEACLGLLEAAGLIRQLSFGELVLLQPEMLDGYCASLAMTARKEPDGLGYIPATRALSGDFYIEKEQRLDDSVMENSMLLATVEEAVSRGVAVRQPTDEGVMVVFPSELRKDFPDFPGDRTLTVAFTFDGPVSAVYATLAVSLIHSVSFAKEELYKNAALFRCPRGGECGFAVEYPDRSNDARGRLTVFFDEKAEKEYRLLFLRYVNRQLEKLALAGSVRRERIYQCPNDGYIIPSKAVEMRRQAGETTVICPVCVSHIPMDDLVEEAQKPDVRVNDMEAQSDEERERQQRITVYERRLELEEYDTFLCHNSMDKPAVRQLKRKLADRGIVSWIDEEGLLAGDSFVPELEKVIEKTPTALVIVGPKWMGQWQRQEYYALLDRAVSEGEGRGRGLRLIPVLLPGVPRKPKLPMFLSGRHYVDFRSKEGLEDREVMRQLVKAILAK